MTIDKPVSPIGSTSTDAASRRYDRSPEYRAQHDRLAPYRVIATAVILGRAAKRFTQDELGRRIGTTGSAISRIESGTRPVTLETLSKLGETLDIAFVVGAERNAPGCVTVPRAAVDGRPSKRAAAAGTSRPANDWAHGDAPLVRVAAKARG